MSSEKENVQTRDYVGELGSALRSQRERLGYTQEGFAIRWGFDRGRWGRIERGGYDITFDTLMTALEALDTQPGDFFSTFLLSGLGTSAHSGPKRRGSHFKAPEDANYRQILGHLLVHYRMRAGYTQEEFAHDSGLARSWLSGLETGRRNPTFSKLMMALEGLQLQPAEFFSGIRLRAKAVRTQPGSFRRR